MDFKIRAKKLEDILAKIDKVFIFKKGINGHYMMRPLRLRCLWLGMPQLLGLTWATLIQVHSAQLTVLQRGDKGELRLL